MKISRLYLSRGDEGVDVIILKCCLSEAGYLPPESVANPLFDEEVERAVMQLQIDVNEEPTGTFGPGTMIAIRIAQLWRHVAFLEDFSDRPLGFVAAA